MIEKKISDLLISYGVNTKSKGFEYTTYVLKQVYFYIINNYKYNLISIIKEIAYNENKAISTIKAQIRYAVTTHNDYGGNLTLKDLEKVVKEKIGRGEL